MALSGHGPARARESLRRLSQRCYEVARIALGQHGHATLGDQLQRSPPSLFPDDDAINPYDTDRAYWESLWWKPPPPAQPLARGAP